MLKNLPIQLFALTFCLLLPVHAQAVPITLFQDTDTYIQRAKDLVVAKCTAVPKDGAEPYIDGLYPVEVQVLLSLKGDRQPGPLKVATIYPMEVGKTYLLANTGGSALNTDFLSLAQLSVVELSNDLDCHRAVQKGPLRGEIGSRGGVEGYHCHRWNGMQARLFAVG